MKLKNIRFWIIFRILKMFYPSFYKRIKYLENKGLFKFNKDNFQFEKIRPSTLFIKGYYQKDLIGVEIGVKKGLNSISLLENLNINKLYLIDCWKNYSNAENENNYYKVLNIFKKNNNVIIIKEFSHIIVNNFKNNFLDFIYIDGNHSYTNVLQDITLWYDKVKNNGILSGHDILNPNVFKAVKDFCNLKNIPFIVKNPDWIFIKNELIKV